MLSLLIAATVVCTANAQGNGYLPPTSKGYNYPTPSVPFPGRQPGPATRPPPPPPSRPLPPPSRPVPPPGTGYPPPRPNSRPEATTEHVHMPGMPFDFSYAVNEDGNDFSHNAISDGDVTRGEYRIALPDGRMQVVKYTADWKNGYNAEVTYEGQASYPDQQSGPGRNYVPPQTGGGYKY